MERDRLAIACLRTRAVRRQLPRAHELIEELGVVVHLVAAAELRVLVPERVEAVRTGGDDLAHAVAIQGFDVALGQHLEQELVADAAGRVSAAGFLAAEDRELDAGLLQQLRGGADGVPVALDEGAAAADPHQDLRLGRVVHVGHHVDVEPLGPVDAAELGAREGMLARLEGVHHVHHAFRELGLFHDQVAAGVDDLGHLLDVDRAGLHAGGAGRAGEQRLGRYGGLLIDDRQQCGVAVSTAVAVAVRQDAVAALVHQGLQVEDDVARRQALADGVRRADIGTAAALGAGVEVEEVLPGEVAEVIDAEALRGLEVDRLE